MDPELIAADESSRRRACRVPRGSPTHSSASGLIPSDTDRNELERAAREEQESIELARQLMAEEAVASYHHHIESLRAASESGQMSQEEYAVWQIAMHEEEREEAEEAEAANELSYDGLLRLSERIGDVKTERWTMVADKEISKLPLCTFDESLCANHGVQNDGDSKSKCLVCQFEYEAGEQLRQLPCSHRFHRQCIDHWLMEKNWCPYCRKCIVSSP